MKAKTWPTWIWSMVALLAIFAFNAILSPAFFYVQVKEGHLYGSLIDIFARATPVAIIALGMTLVIATRGVDLSVGAVVAISGTMAAKMANDGHSGLALIIAASLGVALTLGLCNGLLVSVFGIQPIVATLVLMVSGRGIAQLLSDGQIVTFSNPGLALLGSGFCFWIPLSIWLAVLMLVGVVLVSRGTAIGMFVEAVGDNPVASRFTGIPVRTVLLFCYGLTGLLAGLAGFIIAGQTKAADANNAGLYIELDAILAVVLGGTRLTGGRIQLFGSVVGALLLQTLTTTVLTKGVQTEWMLVIKAAIVLSLCLLQAPLFRQRFSIRRAA